MVRDATQRINVFTMNKPYSSISPPLPLPLPLLMDEGWPCAAEEVGVEVRVAFFCFFLFWGTIAVEAVSSATFDKMGTTIPAVSG